MDFKPHVICKICEKFAKDPISSICSSLCLICRDHLTGIKNLNFKKILITCCLNLKNKKR
jgi:hypothetical protein